MALTTRSSRPSASYAVCHRQSLYVPERPLSLVSHNMISKVISFVVCTLVASFMCAPASAAPTYEQLQLYKERVSIPAWKNESQEMEAVRAKLPAPEATRVWESITAASDRDTGKTPLARITNPRNDAELQLFSLWLRWQILSQNADGRYSYAYALNLIRMSRPSGGDYFKEAATFFLHARFALSLDGARCTDPTAMPAIILGYETQATMRPLVERIAKMPMKERAQVMLEAVAIEEMRGERVYRPWLCVKGASLVAEAFRQGRVPETSIVPEDGSHITSGNTHTVDVTGIEPKLIPLDEWRKKRNQEIERTTKSIASEM